jgi:predicted lysophospholipase L1 biosynthesis ABC-type transport system permease subunit
VAIGAIMNVWAHRDDLGNGNFWKYAAVGAVVGLVGGVASQALGAFNVRHIIFSRKLSIHWFLEWCINGWCI